MLIVNGMFNIELVEHVLKDLSMALGLAILMVSFGTSGAYFDVSTAVRSY